MHTVITGTRIHPERTRQHACHRCGIEFEPHHKMKGERANYCGDCRPFAAELGWCPPRTRRPNLVAA